MTSGSVGAFANLPTALAHQAEARPDDLAYTFLPRGEGDGERITYAELDRRSRAIASRLAERKLAGQRALLLFPSGLEFVEAFYACLYAGVVAVPAPVPDTGRVESVVNRVQSICEDMSPAAVVVPASVAARKDRFGDGESKVAALPWLDAGELATSGDAEWSPEPVRDDQLAMLQYTSGSTAAPKGVMLAHSHLRAQCDYLVDVFKSGPETVMASWTPLFHDMGLFITVLHPLYVGGHSVLMPPMAFLQRPHRWMKAMSDYRATVTGGPNFAYELCARKTTDEDLAELDLSSWDYGFTSAEPIRAETVDRFTARFAPVGLGPNVMSSAFGLAEAACGVTGGTNASPLRELVLDGDALQRGDVVEVELGSPRSRRFVGSGHPVMHEVLIVDPDTHEDVPERTIGEIWVAGPCVADGYWERDDATRETFGARLAGADEGSYLRTGDLGFLDGDQLYVTSRKKDLIVIRGRNLFPQDVELTAETQVAAVRPGCSAAFAIEIDDEERLGMVCEVRPDDGVDLDEVVREVRAAVVAEHGVQPAVVALIEPKAILKTSSGKIQRQSCRDALEQRALHVLASYPAEAAAVPG